MATKFKTVREQLLETAQPKSSEIDPEDFILKNSLEEEDEESEGTEEDEQVSKSISDPEPIKERRVAKRAASKSLKFITKDAKSVEQKPIFYMSALPSHKSKAKYFSMMNNRVIVESMRNGVAGGNLSPEQEAHFKYLKKRFPKYLVASDDIHSSVAPQKAAELEEKIRKIQQTVATADRKLADEMIADLKKKYGM